MFFKKWSGKRLLVWIAGALMLLGFSQAWSLMRSAGNPEKSEPVAAATEEKNMLLTGTVIRQEQVISGDADISWVCRKESGVRVAPGEVLFQESSPAMQRWAEQKAIIAQAEQYRGVNLYRRRLQLWQAIKTGGTGENGAEIQALLLSEGNAEQTTEELPQTMALQTITAPADGVFVQGVDGLENLLTPEQPELTAALLPMKTPPETAMGRLITSDTWYFSAWWEFAPEPGEHYSAKLLGGDFGTCRFTVEQVEKRNAGYRVLCSCTQSVEAVAMVRQLSVKILSE